MVTGRTVEVQAMKRLLPLAIVGVIVVALVAAAAALFLRYETEPSTEELEGA